MFEKNSKGEPLELASTIYFPSEYFNRTDELLTNLAHCVSWIFDERSGKHSSEILLDPDIRCVILPTEAKPLVCQLTDLSSGETQLQPRTEPFYLDIVRIDIDRSLEDRYIKVGGIADHNSDLELCFSFLADGSPPFIAADPIDRELRVSVAVRDEKVVYNIY